jgi:hypothetical protein
MNRAALLMTAAVMTLGLAAPAHADFVRLGSVDVGYRTDLDTAYTRFGGRMEGLRFMAGRSDIFCRSIVVRFDDGSSQNVFSGRLDERRAVYADLRGGMRRIDSIRFLCRSDESNGGKIFIEGDAGRYRDEWRRDRDWDRTWSGIFGGGGGGDFDRRADSDRDHRGGGNWDRDQRGGGWDRDQRGGPGPGPGGEWVSLGTQVFQGGDDRAQTAAGWAGRHVDRIALRPIGSDVRCNRVDAHFVDGYSARLDKNRLLQAGQMNAYDLPGNKQNLDSLYLRCHAIGDSRVTVEIYAHK